MCSFETITQILQEFELPGVFRKFENPVKSEIEHQF